MAMPSIPLHATWVRIPRYVGDAVMQMSILRLLRQVDPSPLVAWGPAHTLGLLEGQGLVEATVPDQGKPGPWELATLLRQHRAQRSVHFPKSLRPALAAWLARVPERIGVSESLAGLFNTHSLPFWKGRGTCLERYGRVLELRWPKLPAMPFADLRAVAPVDLPTRPYICLMPGASTPAKAWEVEHFVSLAERISAEGYLPVVQGSGAERVLGDRVAGAHGLNACGASLSEAITWFAHAAGAVGNDSGLGHLAAACGAPTVSLFGPMDLEMFVPYGPKVKPLRNEGVPCLGCKLRECPVEGHPCLSGIAPDTVWESLVSLGLR
jgi:heptosyltransferase-2